MVGTIQYDQPATRRLADHLGGWCYLGSWCWSQELRCWQIGHCNSSCSQIGLAESKSVLLIPCIISVFVSHMNAHWKHPSAEGDFNNQVARMTRSLSSEGVAGERGWLDLKDIFMYFAYSADLILYLFLKFLSHQFPIPFPSESLIIQWNHWPWSMNIGLLNFRVHYVHLI